MNGRAHAVPVRLTAKRRRKLAQIVAAATSPQRLVLRARILLLAAGGMANAQIARQLGCSVAVVRTWRGRFAIRGTPGLFDKQRSGRPETHGPSARLAVIAIATSIPPDGESQWSQRGIAARLRERGLAISAATAGRVLAEARLRPHKVRGGVQPGRNHARHLRGRRDGAGMERIELTATAGGSAAVAALIAVVVGLSIHLPAPLRWLHAREVQRGLAMFF